MKTVFYRKLCNSNGEESFVPVASYDDQLLSSLPEGAHLVVCRPGCKSYSYKIDPDFASMIAAGRYARDKIIKLLVESSAVQHRHQNRLTPAQEAAWENLIKEMGEDGRSLSFPSATQLADSAVAATQEQADKLMKHPSVKNAWDEFMVMCKLAAENDNKEE